MPPKKKRKKINPTKIPSRYIVTLPVEAESINEIMRFGNDELGFRALKQKWGRIGTQYFKEQIDKGYIPAYFKTPISIKVWIYFKTQRNRDKDNYFFMAKGIIDSMNRLEMFEDDSAEFVDFDGIVFRQDDQRPRIEIEINLRTKKQKNLAISSVELMDAADMALSVMPELKKMFNSEFWETEDRDRKHVVLGIYMSYPTALRPTIAQMAKQLDVNPLTILRWKKLRIVREVALQFVKHHFAYDVPDVIEAMKQRAISGDPTSAKLFMGWVTDWKPELSPTTNINVSLTQSEVESIISNLESKNVKEQRTTESVKVVGGRKKLSSNKDVV